MMLILSLFLVINVVTCYRLGVQSNKFLFRLNSANANANDNEGDLLPAITEARSVLLEASLKKIDDSNVVVKNLLDLEKLMRQQNKKDNGETATQTIKFLNGTLHISNNNNV